MKDKQEYDSFLEELKENVDRSSEFSAVAINCIKSIAEDNLKSKLDLDI